MSPGMHIVPDDSCVNCHFCRKWVHIGSDEKRCSQIKDMSADERERLRRRLIHRDGTWIDADGIVCHKGVFSSNPDVDGDIADWDAILSAKRGESCFFYRFQNVMGVDAASVLEERAANRREAERDRMLTRRAFWVAFSALIVSVLATIANVVWNVWAHFHPFKP